MKDKFRVASAGVSRMAREAEMIWCGDISARGRTYHACVYSALQTIGVYAVVRDIISGTILEVDLNTSQVEEPREEIRRKLKDKISDHRMLYRGNN